jgi:hypothetical protein
MKTKQTSRVEERCYAVRPIQEERKSLAGEWSGAPSELFNLVGSPTQVYIFRFTPMIVSDLPDHRDADEIRIDSYM